MSVRPIGYVFVLGLSLLSLNCGTMFGNMGGDMMSGSDLNNPNRYSPPIDPASEAASALDPSASILSSGNVPVVLPGNQRLYKNGFRATREDFIDESQSAGSLWASNGQTNYYFTKNMIKSPGDMITVKIEGGLYNEFTAEIKSSLSVAEKYAEVSLLQEKYRAQDTLLMSAAAAEKTPLENQDNATSQPSPAASSTPGNKAASSSPAASTPPVPTTASRTVASTPSTASSVPAVPQILHRRDKEGQIVADFSEVDIVPEIELKAGDTLPGEIVERLPNGNYKIKAVKKIFYRHGPPRILSLTGIVRPGDLGEEGETISSSKVYEYQIGVAH